MSTCVERCLLFCKMYSAKDTTQIRTSRNKQFSAIWFLWTPCIKPNVFEAKTLLNVSATFKVFFLTTKLVAEAAGGAAEVGNFSTDSASQILLKIKSKLDSNFFSAKISFKLISCFKKTRPKRCRKDLSNRYQEDSRSSLHDSY